MRTIPGIAQRAEFSVDTMKYPETTLLSAEIDPICVIALDREAHTTQQNSPAIQPMNSSANAGKHRSLSWLSHATSHLLGTTRKSEHSGSLLFALRSLVVDSTPGRWDVAPLSQGLKQKGGSQTCQRLEPSNLDPNHMDGLRQIRDRNLGAQGGQAFEVAGQNQTRELSNCLALRCGDGVSPGPGFDHTDQGLITGFEQVHPLGFSGRN